jgi:nucleotide-binding universal stress UspA family protein
MMNNDVTVYLNNITEHSAAAIAACQFAAQYKGTVTAAYIKLDAIAVMRWQTASPIELADLLLVDLDKRELDAKRHFEALASNYDCETLWRTIPHSQEPIEQLLCTDIIFADQPTVDDPNYQSLLNRIILETKRPVLMIPRDLNKPFEVNKIVLGWNSSAEAMRAASDALPFMQMCQQLTVVDVLTQRMIKRDSNAAYLIEDYLSRKKIPHQLIIDSCKKNSEIPKKLLERAESEQADLIVIGGYGHSRIKEIILGGVTDHLIKHATIAVLFSH